MLKKGVSILTALLLLTSCAPNSKEDDEIVQKDDEQAEEEISIVPSYQLSKDNYKMILPFRPSEARGVIITQLGNRLDINEMEEGLRRHSTEVYSPEKYYFEEGQYISEDQVNSWIDSLNPDKPDEGAKKDEYKDNPRILSHVLEQNFLKKTDDDSVELVGISIGIALKSVYSFTTKTGGPTHHEDISQKEMLKAGKDAAEKVVEDIREIEGLEDVPIMLALYREEEETSPVPGNFVTKTNIESGEKGIGKWEDVDEDYVLFPSDEAKEDHFDEYELVNSFANDISKYFPNYVGVIGEGFYIDDELQQLSIEIPIEFYGAAEVTGFTQYAFGLVKEMFPNYYDLEIKVTSNDQVESLIYQEAGEDEPIVRILH